MNDKIVFWLINSRNTNLVIYDRAKFIRIFWNVWTEQVYAIVRQI